MKLTISHLSKQYRRDFWGLRDFDLELRPGVIGLLGPNGAGKSTLMRMLATITQPTEGTIQWNGDGHRQIARYPARGARLPAAGFRRLSQPDAVWSSSNTWPPSKGMDAKTARRRIDELLVVVNLVHAAKRPLGGYSGGMKQRVGIAQALLNDPQLLIVDEPTVGLDPEERVRFRNLLSDLSGERIIMLSTHIVSDVEATATEIVVINKGRKLQHAAPEKLLALLDGKVWQWVVPSEALPALKQKHIVSGTVRRENGIQVRVVSEPAPAPEAEAGHAQPGGCLPASRLVKTERSNEHAARPLSPGARRFSRAHPPLQFSDHARAGAVARLPGNSRSDYPCGSTNYRGVFNSAWVGSMMTLVVTFFLGWFGFYLVKGSVARDYETGVGQIMATTPLTRPLYLLGKWLSNFAVLDAMVFILMLAAIVMQLIRREDPQIHVWALVAPLLFVALPFMALVAAFAVLFESIRWLRGGFGNVVYFFLFILGITAVAILLGTNIPLLDWLGFGVFKRSMAVAAQAAFPGYQGGLALSMVPARGDVQPFYWSGVTWTIPVILPRLATWGASLGWFYSGRSSSTVSTPPARARAGNQRPNLLRRMWQSCRRRLLKQNPLC